MVPRLFSLLSKMKGRIPSNKFRSACIYIYIYIQMIFLLLFHVMSVCSPSQCERSYPPHNLLFCDIPLTPLTLSPSDPKVRSMYKIFFPWFHNCVADPSVLLCTWHSSWDSMIGLSKAAGDPWPEPRQQHNRYTRCLFTTTETFKTEDLAKSMKSSNIY